MKAQILVRPGMLEFADIPVPECKEDEVLIKIKKACICNGSDPAIFQGAHWITYPVVFGHEAFGEIVESGRKVTDFKPGDRVSWWFAMGAFAEYVCVCPASVAMIKLPDYITDEDGTIFELVGASARAVEAAGIQKGSKVLIIGLGPSGLLMSQWARNLGADIVIGWDLYEMRRKTGLELGCLGVFDNSREDIIENTLSQAGEIDVVIDAYADDLLPEMPTLNHGISVLKQEGKIVSYGHPKKGRMLDNYGLQSKGITLCGPVRDIVKIREYYKKSLEYYEEGTLRVKPLITGSVPLSDVEVGMRLVMEQPDNNIKILVEI
ncbi:MAG: alcohol dehydrogenase catalytic domain-containing protein [Anaerocolumna sp.]